MQILYDKGSVSKKTLQLLNHNLTGVAKQALSPHNEFWDSSKVLKMMQKSKYFNTDEDSVEYPETIMKMLDLGKYIFSCLSNQLTFWLLYILQEIVHCNKI